MAISPISSIVGYAGQSVGLANRQPAPSVKSVSEAARPIVSDVVTPRGKTVGVLATPSRAQPGGLENAGMYTGTSK